ncbi:ATP-binding protein [Catenuloplanes sp. NPDC051500]|uniref:ATP-binding protein n=1 Tax=Catenuloplanes sp. NPDC051500 TaxID=3363959 RepID=UPI0037A39AEC
MSVPVSLVRTVLFAALYLVATIAGRLTIMDGTSLSLVWPAAGVAVVWFGAQRTSPSRWVDVVALSAITVVINMATGASIGLSLAFVLANLVQAGMFLYLMTRWRPHLWGAGGTEPLRGPRDLWALLCAAFMATAAGAAIGPTAVWLSIGHYSPPATAVWLVRNTASMLLIGAVGLCVGHAVSRFRTEHGTLHGWWRHAGRSLARTPRIRLIEYAGLAVCSTAAYLAGFGLSHGLPISFTLIGLTVWASVRLATPFVVLHDLAVGVIVVLYTLHGDGPFASVGSDALRAFVAQLFVAMVAVVGLALALSRDERTALVTKLAASTDEARERAELMHAIIDSMADGLSVVDSRGQVLLRNPAAVRLLGGVVSPNGAVADSRHYGLHHLDGTLLAPQDMPYRRAMAGTLTGMDVLVRNAGVPEGRIVHLKGALLPDHHGSPTAVLLYTDVTAERRHRDELTSFAGVVAHDLLNPLTAVEGWTEATGESLAEIPSHPAVDQARASLQRVERAAVRMSGLINGLLDHAVARDSAIVPARVSLAEVVAEIAAARADASVAAGGPVPEVVIGDLPAAHADPVLVRQLIDNLIGNAIKYTAPGVVPRLTVAASADAGTVRTCISDNGIGIPPGQHEAIFGNFHRAHRAAPYSGTGLGLAICKRIVERHGGTITAVDNPAGGSCFSFTLPAHHEPQPQRARLAAAHHG